jgi:hypothetical protein
MIDFSESIFRLTIDTINSFEICNTNLEPHCQTIMLNQPDVECSYFGMIDATDVISLVEVIVCLDDMM